MALNSREPIEQRIEQSMVLSRAAISTTYVEFVRASTRVTWRQ